MPEATTANYGWSYPTINASADSWGATLNATLIAIDGQVKSNDTAARNADNLSGGTVANARLSGSYTGITGTGTLNAGTMAAGFTIPLGTVSLSGTLPAARGGAGTVNGILKANGAGAVSQALAGSDYAPATSGTALLKGNNSGGFASAAAGSDYAPATSGSSLLKGNGGGGFAAASAGSDYAPATSGSAVLKGNGSGGFAAAAAGSDFAPATAGGAGSAILCPNGSGGFQALGIGSGLTLSAGTLAASVASVNSQTGAVSLTTSHVPEGANLYHTTSRARGAISAGGSLAYDASTGVVSFSDAVTSVNGKTGAVALVSGDISDLRSFATKAQTYSTGTPSGTPANGDMWVQYL